MAIMHHLSVDARFISKSDCRGPCIVSINSWKVVLTVWINNVVVRRRGRNCFPVIVNIPFNILCFFKVQMSTRPPTQARTRTVWQTGWGYGDDDEEEEEEGCVDRPPASDHVSCLLVPALVSASPPHISHGDALHSKRALFFRIQEL